MKELTDAVWDATQKSAWIKVYAEEAYWLAKSIVIDAAKVWELAPQPDSYCVSHELHRTIDGILSSASRLKNLFIPRNKRGRMSNLQFEIHKKRAAWMQSAVNIDMLPTMLDAKVRNTLEHFDEYLDETALLLVEKAGGGPMVIPDLLGVSDRAHLQSIFAESHPDWEVYPTRYYIADERIYVNCGHEIKIGQLVHEANFIFRTLGPQLGHEVGMGRGADIVIIAPNSFEEAKEVMLKHKRGGTSKNSGRNGSPKRA